MSDLVRVAAVADLPEGESTTVSHGKHEVAVFNVGGTIYAINNLCPHAGGPLNEGFVEGTEITCPWHAWTFDLNPETADDDGCIRYTVKIENGEIHVEIP
jgi:nitrite reductase (NADH) small subunit